MAQKLVQSISEPYPVGSLNIRIGASLGIAIHPLEGEQLDELMRLADQALYQIKFSGKGNYAFSQA